MRTLNADPNTLSCFRWIIPQFTATSKRKMMNHQIDVPSAKLTGCYGKSPTEGTAICASPSSGPVGFDSNYQIWTWWWRIPRVFMIIFLAYPANQHIYGKSSISRWFCRWSILLGYSDMAWSRKSLSEFDDFPNETSIRSPCLRTSRGYQFLSMFNH